MHEQTGSGGQGIQCRKPRQGTSLGTCLRDRRQCQFPDEGSVNGVREHTLKTSVRWTQVAALVVVALCLLGTAAETQAADNSAAAIEAGRRAYDAGAYDKAVETLKSVVAHEPDNGAAHHWLTRTYYEMHQIDAAVAEGERAVALEPNNSMYHVWLGLAYGMKAEHAGPFFSGFFLARKTRKEFEEAVRLDPHNFTAQQDMIEFYCKAPGIVGGGEDKAQRAVNELMRLDEAEGLFAKGNCSDAKKRYQQADAEFDAALEAKPKRTAVLYGIADYELGRDRDRVETLQQAVEMAAALDPADLRQEFYRGVVLVMKNMRMAEAERLLKNYIQNAPMRRIGFPQRTLAETWLGRAYEQQGDRNAAMTAYQTALASDPKNKAAREALKRLEKAQGK